jgi:hypothetical protein
MFLFIANFLLFSIFLQHLIAFKLKLNFVKMKKMGYEANVTFYEEILCYQNLILVVVLLLHLL